MHGRSGGGRVRLQWSLDPQAFRISLGGLLRILDQITAGGLIVLATKALMAGRSAALWKFQPSEPDPLCYAWQAC